jgi:hypothetical protein
MTHFDMQQEGFIRVHGPWLPGVFRVCKNRWDPLEIHIDGAGNRTTGVPRNQDSRTDGVA